jgi:hypothetical protein
VTSPPATTDHSCSAAIAGAAAGETRAGEVILAYEHVVFRAVASGAQLYVRCHHTGHMPPEVADELNVIFRRLRMTLALLAQEFAESPPAQQMPATLAGEVRSWARTFGQIAAHRYREAARLDAANLDAHRPAVSTSVPGGDLR